MTAPTVCARLDAPGGVATTSEVVRWEAGAWGWHRCGIAANDFPIDPDRGYFSRATASASITLTGSPPDPKQGRLLEGGWSLIGFGTPSPIRDAPTVISSFDGLSGSVATAIVVARWGARAWELFQRNLPVNLACSKRAEVTSFVCPAPLHGRASAGVRLQADNDTVQVQRLCQPQSSAEKTHDELSRRAVRCER
jgi:hypothetical protein